MATRLTRTERKQATRSELVAAARTVFLRRGFHAASLDEIAEEAGFTKGAVYSNFDGKDDLFLAVLDDHVDQRVARYEATAFKEETMDGFIRLMARGQFVADAEDVAWQPLLVEFWTHASRDEALRQQVSERHSRVIDAAAAVLVQLADREDLELAIAPHELARGAAALSRGMSLELLLEPARAELVEQMLVAYVHGLVKPR
jgi:AcrR family transcriptional regulator